MTFLTGDRFAPYERMKEEVKKEVWDLMSSDGWKLHSKVNEVIMETKVVGECPVYVVRAKGNVNAHVDKVFDIMSDMEGRKEWDAALREFVMLETMDEDTYIAYELYHVPFPLQSRDVVYMRGVHREDGKVFLYGRSVTHPDKPQSRNAVRASILYWGYLIEPTEKEGECQCTYMIQMDPKGWVPSWLVNQLAGKSHNYISKMRELV